MSSETLNILAPSLIQPCHHEPLTLFYIRNAGKEPWNKVVFDHYLSVYSKWLRHSFLLDIPYVQC